MNKEIKNSIYYSFPLAILGALEGLVACLIVTAIALPKYDNMLLRREEIKDIKIFLGLANFFSSARSNIIGIIFILVSWVVIFWFLKNLSGFEDVYPYKTTAKWKKFVLFISIVIPPVLLWTTMNLSFFQINETKWIPPVLFASASGMLWIFASAKWLCGTESEPIFLKYKWCFLLGVAGILTAYGVFALVGNTHILFYYFVSNVLSYPYEVFISQKAVIFLAGIFSFSGFFMAGVIAPILYSFAPVKISFKKRLLRILPGLYLFIFVIIGYQGFKLYLNKFDYNKKSFVEAIGISENQKKIKTVVILTKDKKGKVISKLENVPIEESLYFNFLEDFDTFLSKKVSLTEQNLRKIEEYTKSHKKSFYLREAHRVLVSGYFMNWDTVKGFPARHIAGRDYGDIMSRMLELPGLSRLPVTEEYRKYLDEWANEEKYYHGPLPLISLAKAYKHFGNSSKMKYFKKKALEHPAAENRDKERIKDLRFPAEGVLTNGIIKGRILTGNNLPQPEKVGLFWADPEHPREPSLSGLALSIILISSQDIDRNGIFEFTDIGEGYYQLAFMFDSKKLSADEKIKVLSNPGFISLNKTFPQKDLGVIKILKYE
ncbi:MAG: hypothetical protein JW983_05470 [Elusimicrobia bacterium]|nr:hypothetical protein [Elusimicrobiota bacterium]